MGLDMLMVPRHLPCGAGDTGLGGKQGARHRFGDALGYCLVPRASEVTSGCLSHLPLQRPSSDCEDVWHC